MIRLPRQPGSWHWDRGKRPFREPQLVGLSGPLTSNPCWPLQTLVAKTSGSVPRPHGSQRPGFRCATAPTLARHDQSSRRSLLPGMALCGPCSCKDFLRFYASAQGLGFVPRLNYTCQQICRLNISCPFDASRGNDKNSVCSFTGALLRGESAQEVAADQEAWTHL